MIVDTSVLAAILFNEPERDAFVVAISAAPSRLISSVTRLEAAIVLLARLGEPGARELDALVATAGLVVLPFDAAQAKLAIEAALRFGRGRHAARLNFGDCAAYAASRVSGEALLFKGGDFRSTDVAVHPASV